MLVNHDGGRSGKTLKRRRSVTEATGGRQ